jgi:hypothetical protein
MNPGDLLLRARSRAVWADPARTLLTLESFARTEADGGRDIASAARRVGEPELRRHLERHAGDEQRHAELFRRRAEELRAAGGAPVAAATAAGADVAGDAAYDLSRGRPAHEVDAHGFLSIGLLDELGEVPYVAMLHVAEERAARLFKLHAELTRGDEATHSIFESILRDEHYHVAWTRAVLDGWKADGRKDEVKRALKDARQSRLLGAWKRLGVRAGGSFGRVLLVVMYFTVLLPFGLLARARRDATGWRASRRAARRDGDLLAAARTQI